MTSWVAPAVQGRIGHNPSVANGQEFPWPPTHGEAVASVPELLVTYSRSESGAVQSAEKKPRPPKQEKGQCVLSTLTISSNISRRDGNPGAIHLNRQTANSRNGGKIDCAGRRLHLARNLLPDRHPAMPACPFRDDHRAKSLHGDHYVVGRVTGPHEDRHLY